MGKQKPASKGDSSKSKGNDDSKASGSKEKKGGAAVKVSFILIKITRKNYYTL